MSDLVFTSEPANITITDGPAVIRLVVPIELDETVHLNQIMQDGPAVIRIEQPQ